MSKPFAPDLYCGLGGWTEGLIAEGYDVEGYDIEAHEYGDAKYPGRLVLADVRTLHGSRFKDAALIVASPPCTEFSYMALPWKRAKQIARALRGQDDFPPGYTGSRTVEELTALFDACFRIQREASEAAGHHVPMVVENVRGAQSWVGRAAWNFGSYYLWGDVPALMPQTLRARKFNPDGTSHGKGSWFAIADSKQRGARSQHVADIGGPRHEAEGIKQGGTWFHDNKSASRMHSSKSPQRKAATAKIAKIPFALSSWIARTYKPTPGLAA